MVAMAATAPTAPTAPTRPLRRSTPLRRRGRRRRVRALSGAARRDAGGVDERRAVHRLGGAHLPADARHDARRAADARRCARRGRPHAVCHLRRAHGGVASRTASTASPSTSTTMRALRAVPVFAPNAATAVRAECDLEQGVGYSLTTYLTGVAPLRWVRASARRATNAGALRDAHRPGAQECAGRDAPLGRRRATGRRRSTTSCAPTRRTTRRRRGWPSAASTARSRATSRRCSAGR